MKQQCAGQKPALWEWLASPRRALTGSPRYSVSGAVLHFSHVLYQPHDTWHWLISLIQLYFEIIYVDCLEVVKTYRAILCSLGHFLLLVRSLVVVASTVTVGGLFWLSPVSCAYLCVCRHTALSHV